MKKFMACVLCLCLSVSLSAAASALVTYDGLRYMPGEASCVVTGYEGLSRGVLTVPGTLGGQPVTAIADNAFSSLHHLTGIVLPDSIVSIGDQAFENMFVGSFTLGSGLVSIGKDAFRMCEGLPSFALPASLTTIGNGAFYQCYSLEYITIPPKVADIGVETFRRCPTLKKVAVMNPDAKIDPAAFDPPEDTSLTIYAPPGSRAEAFAADNGYAFAPYYPIKINGRELIPGSALPEMKNNTLYVPLRFVVEALYHTVDYERGEILIDGGAYAHVIGTDYITNLGDIRSPAFQGPSYLKNGVTMVTPDFIKATLGCEVLWDKAHNAVEITAV